MKNYKVLLTASGIGSRLGDLTKFTNKSLVTVGNKPVICYIIEKYPKEIEFVVTLGYFGSHVKQFLKIAYPQRKFTFVYVDNYNGKGSSLAWSQICAKDHLQCPFIYNACDTIVTSKIPCEIKENWIGVSKGKDSSQYDSVNLNKEKYAISLHDKGYIGSSYLHIGLIGVLDYKEYWNTIENLYNSNPNDKTLNDVSVIKKMLSNGKKWKTINFNNWIDIGNVDSLKNARIFFKNKFNVLEKSKESISIVNDKIIKFFYDDDIVKKRVLRSKLLPEIVPTISSESKNFYSYDYIKGNLASDVITPELMKDLINWANCNLWKKVDLKEDFSYHCNYFYKVKTKNRIKEFLSKYAFENINYINNIKINSLNNLLDKVPWDFLINETPRQFHGDFILDNIIIGKNNKFNLIDWRHEFGDNLTSAGDVYYDLAKMNHNLTVNHDIVCKNLFKIEVKKDRVNIDILRKDSLVKCNETFLKEVKKLGYNIDKIEILTGLVWLNMSSLHHYPFDKFLYYYGILKLFLSIENYYKNIKESN